MKKYLLTILISFIALGTQAQVGEKGKFYIDFGGGVGVYKTDFTYKDNLSNVEGEDTVATTYGAFGVEYGIMNWVSAGLNFKSGQYLYENANGRSNKWKVLELSSHFYFLNKEKFTLYGNATIGSGFLTETGTWILWPYERKFSGAHYSLGLGFKWLFIKEKVGIFMNYEFNRYGLDMKEYVLNNQDQDLSNVTATHDVKGSELKFGLSIKL